MSYLCEMENVGLIVVGRLVNSEFESADAIEDAADAVATVAAKYKLPISFIYCGTTINWPDDYEYTASMVGLVTHEHYGDDEDEGAPVPASAFEKKEIPEEFWSELSETTGMKFSGSNATYLAVAGWTWTDLSVNGERVVGADSEGSGYTKIDGNDQVMNSSETLMMRASYC